MSVENETNASTMSDVYTNTEDDDGSTHRPNIGAGAYLHDQIAMQDASSDVATTDTEGGSSFYLGGDEDVFSKAVQREEQKIVSLYGLPNTDDPDSSYDREEADDVNDSHVSDDESFPANGSLIHGQSIFADSYDGILQRIESPEREKFMVDTPAGKRTAKTFFDYTDDEDHSLTLPAGPPMMISRRITGTSSPSAQSPPTLSDRLRALPLTKLIIILFVIMLLAIGLALASWGVDKNRSTDKSAAVEVRPPSSFIPDGPTVAPALQEPTLTPPTIDDPGDDSVPVIIDCEMDSDESVFINEQFGRKSCEWLSTRPAQQELMCLPENEGYTLCPKTCNSCSTPSQSPSGVTSMQPPVLASAMPSAFRLEQPNGDSSLTTAPPTLLRETVSPTNTPTNVATTNAPSATSQTLTRSPVTTPRSPVTPTRSPVTPTRSPVTPTRSPVTSPTRSPVAAPTQTPSLRPTLRVPPSTMEPTTVARANCEDRDGFFFVTPEFPEQNCEWLKNRPGHRKRLCRPRNEGYAVCIKTCGNWAACDETSAPAAPAADPVLSTSSPTITPVAATPDPDAVPCGVDSPSRLIFVNDVIGFRTCGALSRIGQESELRRVCRPGQKGWEYCKATCGNTCAPVAAVPSTLQPSSAKSPTAEPTSVAMPSPNPTVLRVSTPPPTTKPTLNPTRLPTGFPTKFLTDLPTAQPVPTDRLRSAIAKSLPASSVALLDDTLTPQGKALEWLQGNSRVENMPEWILVQRWALAGFAYSLNYENWNSAFRWLGDSNRECLWQGVDCNQEGRVNSIQLLSNDIEGELFPELFVLGDTLVTLDLRNNDIEGPLPSQYGRMSALLHLNLQRNEITGTIPAELGFLNALEINLAYNHFSGTIPSTLANILRLERLYLFDNDLTGEMPTEVCDSKLDSLEADCRELTCGCCTQCWFQCGGRHPPC